MIKITIDVATRKNRTSIMKSSKSNCLFFEKINIYKHLVTLTRKIGIK